MKALRKIEQNTVNGSIFMHSMPGLKEDLVDFMDTIKKNHVERIYCLTDIKEIEDRSPHYLEALYYGHYDRIAITYNPNPDFGVPVLEKDLLVYDKAIHEAYNILKEGNILIHCRGGAIGNSGTPFCRSRNFVIIVKYHFSIRILSF